MIRRDPKTGRNLPAERIKKICLCGKVFLSLPDWCARPKKFCSRSCASVSRIGKKRPELGAKLRKAFLGRSIPCEQKERISKSLRQRYKNGHKQVWDDNRRTIQSKAALRYFKTHPGTNLGKKFSEETRRKMSLAQRGEKGSMWRGGVYPLRKSIRRSKKYKEWARLVKERDDFTCKMCGETGGVLHSDHIIPFTHLLDRYKIGSIHQALDCNDLWDLENGRTLCKSCHLNTETYGTKALQYTDKAKMLTPRGAT